MAEPQEVRNRRAQRDLAAMGIDPGPLRGAANRLRKVRGAAKGYSPAQAVGKPKVGERFVSRPDIVQARPRLRTQRVKSLGGRQITPIGPGRIVQTTSARVLRQQLRQAARAGERMAARITAMDHRGVRTHTVDGTPEQRARMAARIAAAGGRKLPPDSPHVILLAKPQLTFSSSPEVFDQGDGFDPLTVLAWLDTYDDDERAWADMWDWEYQ